jgi:hypothetical protein
MRDHLDGARRAEVGEKKVFAADVRPADRTWAADG